MMDRSDGLKRKDEENKFTSNVEDNRESIKDNEKPLTTLKQREDVMKEAESMFRTAKRDCNLEMRKGSEKKIRDAEKEIEGRLNSMGIDRNEEANKPIVEKVEKEVYEQFGVSEADLNNRDEKERQELINPQVENDNEEAIKVILAQDKEKAYNTTPFEKNGRDIANEVNGTSAKIQIKEEQRANMNPQELNDDKIKQAKEEANCLILELGIEPFSPEAKEKFEEMYKKFNVKTKDEVALEMDEFRKLQRAVEAVKEKILQNKLSSVSPEVYIYAGEQLELYEINTKDNIKKTVMQIREELK